MKYPENLWELIRLLQIKVEKIEAELEAVKMQQLKEKMVDDYCVVGRIDYVLGQLRAIYPPDFDSMFGRDRLIKTSIALISYVEDWKQRYAGER